MKKIRLTLKLLTRNIGSLLVFELVYHALLTLVFIPLREVLFSLSLKAAGLKYLSQEKLLNYILNPLTLILLILLGFIMAFVVIVEVSALIYCFHASYYDEKVTAKELFYVGFAQLKRFLKERSFLLVIYVVLIVPFVNIGVHSGYISAVQIPEFIMDAIRNNMLYSISFYLAYFLLVLYALKSLFALPFYSMLTISYREARQKSRMLMKGKMIRTVWNIMLWNLLQFICLAVVTLVVLEIIILLSKAFGGVTALNTAYACGETAMAVISAITALMGVPMGFARINGMLLDYSREKELTIPTFEHVKMIRIPKGLTIAFNVVFVLCAAGTVAVMTGNEFLDIANINILDNQPDVQAHRGNSVAAPENSMPAFLAAIEAGADWIELDVHQTSDNVVVVTHDKDLKRIGNVNKNIWSITYDELISYDTGSWFAPEFSYVRVSTLDEVLKATKGKIKLNIELKPTGHEPDFEKNVIKIVHDNGFENDCVLASLNYKCLENIKALDPTLKTLYIMPIAVGDIWEYEAADHFSLEASSINASLIEKLHAAGHEVYAWTVNEEQNVIKMITLGVDAIITDDPIKTEQLVHRESVTDVIQWFIESQFPPVESIDPADTKIDPADVDVY